MHRGGISKIPEVEQERRRKLSDLMKQRTSDPDWRRKMSALSRARWNNPASRSKQIVALRKATVKNDSWRAALRHPHIKNRAWLEAIPYLRRKFALNLRRDFGITLSEYDELIQFQGGRCAICIGMMTPAHIDHCHRNGHVRGLLCSPCNLRLGWYEKVKIAIDTYMEASRG